MRSWFARANSGLEHAPSRRRLNDPERRREQEMSAQSGSSEATQQSPTNHNPSDSLRVNTFEQRLSSPAAQSAEQIGERHESPQQASVLGDASRDLSWPVELFRQPPIANHPTISVPVAVQEAIKSYQPPPGFTLVPSKTTERSIILQWGVRVTAELDGKTCVGWICLGSESCRENPQIIQLYGKTSKATKHLKEVHDVNSDKTVLQADRKRTRETELDRLRNAAVRSNDAARVCLLLETLRIVFNNLPFRLGEYEESKLLNELVTDERYRTTINAQAVTHSIVELYASAKGEMMKFIFENIVPNTKSLTIVTDMWSSKSQAEKYLGLRLYFIDNQWRFRSFLLGTRHFRPSYGERDGGIRAPFKRWIEQILTDFGLSLTNIFGATSDAGADVKWMLTEGLKLRWEWCIPHMTNAATKAACGIVNDKTKSKNKPMTELISRIGRTVYQVRHVEVMGSLFSDLCEMTGESRSRTLIEFKPHRFMGLTKVILRILEKWDQLVVWFDERINRALRAGLAPPEGFPLAADKLDLIQLVCILEPITLLNRRAQSESANQIDVLLTLYRLRQNVLDPSVALVDYRTKHLRPSRYFSVTELTPLVAKTRQLLADAFHDRFFSRYTNRSKVRKMSYIFEIQLLLHPKLKNPDGVLAKMIRLCNQQLVIDLAHPAKRLRPDEVSRMVTYVKTTILDQLKSLMLSTTPALDVPPMPSTNSQPFVFSEDLMEFYEQDDGVADAPANNAQISRIEDELERWINQPVTMGRNEENQAEHVLAFWSRQPTQSYLFLPSVARVVFAVPSSSAQIERDFGVSGMMVTSQRSSISAMNIDMCSFLNRNRDFIDVTQCPRLQGDEYRNNIPTNVLLPMEDDSDYLDISAEWENVMTTCFSESVEFEEG